MILSACHLLIIILVYLRSLIVIVRELVVWLLVGDLGSAYIEELFVEARSPAKESRPDGEGDAAGSARVHNKMKKMGRRR